MLINEIRPSQSLAEFVRLYRIVDFKFPAGVVIPKKAYPPRPEHCLQFMPRHVSRVEYPENRSIVKQQNAMLIGQHTVLNNRSVGRELLSIQVVFQPYTIFRWFGISTHELNNIMIDASDVFSGKVKEVNERLAYQTDYACMISIIEQFLLGELRRAKKDKHPVDAIFDNVGIQSLETLANAACLSYRQFDRKFIERAGIGPKEFLRVLRFDKAFRMKNKFPEMDWLTIAIQCGFYDYQHLTKDYKHFTGVTPVEFFSSENAPERLLGHAET